MVKKTKTAVKKSLSHELNRNWPVLMGLGILFIILGFLGLNKVIGVTLVSIIFIGFLFTISGIAQFIDVFKSKEWKIAIGHGVIAMLYLFGGLLIIYDPILASTVITALIAWTMIVIGITRLIMAFQLHQTDVDSKFLFVSSFAAIILGGIILMEWPMSSLWLIGLFISIELLMAGFSYILMAFSVNKKLK